MLSSAQTTPACQPDGIGPDGIVFSAGCREGEDSKKKSQVRQSAHQTHADYNIHARQQSAPRLESLIVIMALRRGLSGGVRLAEIRP